jgi:hypothetical protein
VHQLRGRKNKLNKKKKPWMTFKEETKKPWMTFKEGMKKPWMTFQEETKKLIS